MMTRLGIDGTVLTWLKSNLSDRSQRVSIDDTFLLVSTLLFGVHERSVLGPILFTLFTLPIADITPTHGLDVHFYADHTHLYMTFDPIDHEHTTSILNQVENYITDIHIWMVQIKLNLMMIRPKSSY